MNLKLITCWTLVICIFLTAIPTQVEAQQTEAEQANTSTIFPIDTETNSLSQIVLGRFCNE